MFKKTLLATALMGMAGLANAVPTLVDENAASSPVVVPGSSPLVTYSTEGARAATVINSGQVQMRLGVEYKEDDLIVVTFDVPLASGTDIDSLFGSLRNDLFDFEGFDTDGSGVIGDDPADILPGEKIGEITLGLLESTRNMANQVTGVTLRITTIQADDLGGAPAQISTRNQLIDLTQNGDFTFDGAAVRARAPAAGASMSVRSVTASGVNLDGTSAASPVSADLIAFDTQFTATLNSQFDNVIDVEVQDGQQLLDLGFGLIETYEMDYFADAPATVFDGYWGPNTTGLTDAETREHFVGADEDTIEITINDLGDDAPNADSDDDSTDAAFVRANVTINGTFTGFAADCSDISFSTGSVSNCSVTSTAIRFEYSATDTFEVTLNETGNVLAESVFSVDVDVEYNDAGADHTVGNGDDVPRLVGNSLITAADAGEWVYNGTAITIYSAPWSDVVELFVWVTNSGSEDAEITASIAPSTGGPAVNLGTLTTVAAGEIKQISNQLMAALRNVASAGRATITIVSSADRSAINIDASYKHTVDADRLRLNTTQTLNERIVESSKAKD